MASGNKDNRPTVRIGVFIPADCQVLDAASVDIMGSLSHKYMTMVSRIVPQAVVDLAPLVDVHWIGTVAGGKPMLLTSNQSVIATDHYGDAAVAPGKLDIVLIPGPDPFASFEAGPLAWLKAQFDTPGVDILSVCTGIFVCGDAGILKGRTACGPRGMQEMIKAKGWGQKELVGHKYRWVQDGNLWTSGGVTNGNDLVAAYCRASRHFPTPLVEILCEMMDVGERPQGYTKEMEWPAKVAEIVKNSAAHV
ncbi:ThiJ/PfpI family protein [Jackrogersella minutella]|nr:ThiJ/PfpI family protein [Jackrogersella minutella]